MTLTPLQERVLGALTEHDRPASVLAAELGVTGKALSGPLRALAKAGLAKETTYWPKRGSTWRFTDAGAAYVVGAFLEGEKSDSPRGAR